MADAPPFDRTWRDTHVLRFMRPGGGHTIELSGTTTGASSVGKGVPTTVREGGERVIAAKPWPTGWEDWRPPTAWRPLALPDGWDVT